MEHLVDYPESDSDGQEEEYPPKCDPRGEATATGTEKNVNKPSAESEREVLGEHEKDVSSKGETSLEGCKMEEPVASDTSDCHEVTDYLGLCNEDTDSDEETGVNEANFIRGDRVWSKPIPSKINKTQIQNAQGVRSKSSETGESVKKSAPSKLDSNTENKTAFPRSSFWHGGSRKDDWSKPENIWGNIETSKAVTARSWTVNSDDSCTNSKRNRTNIEPTSSQSECQNVKENTRLSKSCFFVHHNLSPYLHQTVNSQPPRRMFVQLEGHAGAVNRIKWCKPEYSHLLASASMDTCVKVWNVFSKVDHSVQTLRFHTKAVRDLCWSPAGNEIISCGFDKVACLQDVVKGSLIRKFEHYDFLTCIKYHPVNPNYIVAGSRNQILCWDVRSNDSPKKVFHHKNTVGLVQDLIFLQDGTEFAVSTEVVNRESSDRSIIVYDFGSGVVLSNQVYQERYTCPRLCEHPHLSEMMAQTNGDYMALFSTIRPYKMNKCKRFDKHKVQGYAVGCGYSSDGRHVVSGGSDGKVTIYDYQRAIVLQSLGEQGEIYLDVAWHPVLKSTLASSTWSGKITIWQ